MASGWSLASLGGRGQYTITTNIHETNRNRSRNVWHRGRGNIWGQWAEPGNPERGLHQLTSDTKGKQSQLAREEERNEEKYVECGTVEREAFRVWYSTRRGKPGSLGWLYT